MKKIIAVTVVAVMLAMAVGAAGSREQAPAGDKLVVMTSFYIPYDLTSKVAGDHAQVINLVPTGVEPHDWEPSIGDMRRLETADILVVNGAGMEGWLDKVLASLSNKNLTVVRLSDGVELLAGGQDHDHEHEAEDAHDHDHGSFTEADVENRTLADFAGEWQSIYPYMLDGTLDDAVRHAAEDSEMSYAEMSEYYKKGFATDIDRLVVKGNSITFHTSKGQTTVSYAYDGFIFLNYEDYDAQSAIYRFKATSKVDGRLTYLLFADHGHTAGPAEHFHLNFSETPDISVAQTLVEFPTYFPASYTAAQIAAEMAAHGESEEHDHEEEHDHDHGDFDPHTWLDIKNAIIGLGNVTKALKQADPANAAAYQANHDAWVVKFSALDQRFRTELAAVSDRPVVVSHAAFGYMAHAYGFEQEAIEGVYADSEPSPARMAAIIDLVREHGITTIFTEQLVSPKVAQAIARETGVKTAVLDPIEGLTQKDLDAGRDYLSVMEDNLNALVEALK